LLTGIYAKEIAPSEARSSAGLSFRVIRVIRGEFFRVWFTSRLRSGQAKA